VRRVGQARRRDLNEDDLVAALEAVHARVWRISGKGCPDLLVLFQGRYTPLEVKGKSGRLTKAQAGIPWPVVRTADECYEAIGFKPVAASRSTH
jgi:hypothetical protein